MIVRDRRVRIISGFYGSGKTEFSVNYAVKLVNMNRNPVLADIDILNPYFRSRERESELSQLGVRVIAGSVNAPAVDVPAVSSGVYSIFDGDEDAVIDVGGDRAGAEVLSLFSDRFNNPDDYDLFFLINANRPQTANPAAVIDCLRGIESACGLPVTGLINNTHMLKSTQVRDILKGYDLAVEVSRKTGIPLRYNSGLREFELEIPDGLEGEFFPVDLYMREAWMS